LEEVMKSVIEAPICKLGYPDSQLRKIFKSDETYKRFFSWMRGQTFSSCDGTSYNHEKKALEPTNCGPHGYVYYASDVNRFIEGRPVID
jgi:hypothetical protein